MYITNMQIASLSLSNFSYVSLKGLILDCCPSICNSLRHTICFSSFNQREPIMPPGLAQIMIMTHQVFKINVHLLLLFFINKASYIVLKILSHLFPLRKGHIVSNIYIVMNSLFLGDISEP